MGKLKKMIKDIFTKIFRDNYLNFILTVIAILLYWNVTVIDERGRELEEQLWNVEAVWELHELSGIANNLEAIRDDYSRNADLWWHRQFRDMTPQEQKAYLAYLESR